VTHILTRFTTGHLSHAVKTGVARLDQEALTAVRAHLTQLWQAIEALELATRDGHTDTYHRCYEPELDHLLRATSAAFQGRADNVTLGRSAFASTDVDHAVAAVDDKVTTLRTSGASRDYSLEEVARFYAFLISVKSLVKALEGPVT
jgi:hypothetical protein